MNSLTYKKNYLGLDSKKMDFCSDYKKIYFCSDYKKKKKKEKK